MITLTIRAPRLVMLTLIAAVLSLMSGVPWVGAGQSGQEMSTIYLPVVDLVGPDSGPRSLELVGQYGGAAFAVESDGDRTYFGWGVALLVADTSDKSQPKLVGESPMLQGAVEGLAVEDGVAYVAAGGAGLIAVDVSDPTEPQVLWSQDLPGHASDVALADGVAIVAAGREGLHVVDISVLGAPALVSGVSTSGYASDVRIDGIHAYVASDSAGLQVIDIASPAAPREIGSVWPGGNAHAVAVAAGHAFVGIAPSGVAVVDVSRPESPERISTVGTDYYVQSVVVSGTRAYIVESFRGTGIYDISSPVAPREIGRMTTPSSATDISVGDGFAYAVAEDGLHVVDVSDPNACRLLGSAPLSMVTFSNVRVVDDVAYATAMDARVHLIDVSNPSAPFEAGVFETIDTVEAVDVAGDIAYVAADDAGLRVVDVADPTSPQEIAFVEFAEPAVDVQVVDDYAYVATLRPCLTILDVSRPASPRVVGTYESLWCIASQVAVTSDRAYLYTGLFGYVLVDIMSVAEPTNPEHLSTFAFAQSGSELPLVDLEVRDGLAYVAANEAGFHVVDVSTPTAETMLSSIDVGGSAFAVEVVEGTAIVADVGIGPTRVDSGLLMIDVADPEALSVVDFVDVPGYVWDIDSSADLLYAASLGGGLLVYRMVDGR